VVNDPEVKPSLCFPGKSEVAKEVAEITGKQLAALEAVVAGVRCSRPEGKVPKKYACVGCGTCVRTCPKKIIELFPRGARVWVPCSTKDSGKRVKEICQAGCISCKMCVKVCPAKAVRMEDNVVAIDQKACIAFGPDCKEVCVEKCPRKIFRTYRPASKETQVAAAA
jgi:electron transport complex protein RnfB